ncbi:hypothetical protein BDY19DRAFT_991827 [Irpex rosettiformis]|uniref:Uncharacterized protein n=1 Tax=Irpex rosettiformis TaxID=378272 RepID=A0ACB8UAP2_9APHY|nr:hypothetical protein BDY19DRAFT_991827 [Irpex rosettiformis]
MFTTLISIALVSSVALRGALADFTVSSPAINECEPFHLTWSGQNGQVNAIVVDAAQPCDSLLVDLGDHSNGALTWPGTHNLTAGTKVQVSLEDDKGDEAWSSVITVGQGNCTASASASASPSSSVALSSAASPTASISSSFLGESGTTLVVAATASPVSSSSGTDSGSGSSNDTPANAIGAVNQGVLSGAPALHKLSAPAVALTALAAILAVSF